MIVFASLFNSCVMPEYTKVVHVEEKTIRVEVGSLLYLGKGILMPESHVSFISAHTLDIVFWSVPYIGQKQFRLFN